MKDLLFHHHVFLQHPSGGSEVFAERAPVVGSQSRGSSDDNIHLSDSSTQWNPSLGIPKLILRLSKIFTGRTRPVSHDLDPRFVGKKKEEVLKVKVAEDSLAARPGFVYLLTGLWRICCLFLGGFLSKCNYGAIAFVGLVFAWDPNRLNARRCWHFRISSIAHRPFAINQLLYFLGVGWSCVRFCCV